MTLKKREIADLKAMALEGAKNHQIAAALGISLEEVHAARSQLGYTIPKVAEIKRKPCSCCGAPTPIDDDHEWTMPDGTTTAYLCERCGMAVEYINSFYGDDDEDECEEDGDAVQCS